jgi:ceramide glucosyltransferase
MCLPRRPLGLVTCPYSGALPVGPAAILEAIGIGADFMPAVLVSRILEGISFGLGSTMVIPREALDAVGGFEPLRDQLADDYQIGNRIKRAGYELMLSDYVAESILGPVRAKEMWSRRLRWARTTRACRPGGYAGLVITHGFALALLLCCALGFSPAGREILLTVAALRLSTAACVAIAAGDRVVLRHLYIVPASDLVTFALYLVSFCGKSVRWRGEEFRLLDDGLLEEALTPPPG